MKISKKILTLAALSASLVLAQPRHGGTPPDPATMIQNRVNFLTTQLTLTSAQQTQATTIFTNAQTASQSVMDSLKANRQALDAAIKANNPATIHSLAVAAGGYDAQLVEIQSNAQAAFYAILTADQQTKLGTLHGGGPGGPGPGGMGMRRGAPPQQ